MLETVQHFAAKDAPVCISTKVVGTTLPAFDCWTQTQEARTVSIDERVNQWWA